MKQQLNHTLILLTLIGALTQGCKKDAPATIPVLTTKTVTNIAQNSAISGGQVTDNGGADVTAQGVCWSTNPDPTPADNKTENTIVSPDFGSELKELTVNTNYYIRAYAINSAGTGYGNTLTFTTLPALLPVIKGAYPLNITQTSAQCGGEVTSDGGAPTTKGVCWSTNENPTIADSKTVDGTGVGVFTSNLNGFTLNTTYYVRAYATNVAGTAYGNSMVVRTLQSTVTDIDGNVYNTVVIGTQEWMAENLKVTHYRNGDVIPNITETNPWDNSPWDNTQSGAWCNYNNDPANKNIYGLLYNHYTVTDTKGLCPIGWHIPSDMEWITLINYLGGEEVAGYKLKKAGEGINADNSTGFAAMAGGEHQNHSNVPFSGLREEGYWWSATPDDLYGGYYYGRYMNSTERWFKKADDMVIAGYSVRCIKDN